MAKFKKNVLVCAGAECSNKNSEALFKNLKDIIKEKSLENEIQVLKVGCFGLCATGPTVQILPDDTYYVKVKPEEARKIVEEDLIKGNKVEELMYLDEKTGKRVSNITELGFFKKQLRIVLRNCGVVDPENIKDFIAVDGYQAVAKALSMKPEEVIEEVKKSGLRGRGGGGFPTGIKWAAAAKAKGSPKYVVCNADEGDPGAFMDRSVLEGDPHSVLEGMIVCSYAVGASIGYVYIRAEYPLAIRRLQKALDDAREYGLLGDNILGSGHSFDIDIKIGAGAFVCGEETALIRSMEGNRGEPYSKPPFPADVGYKGKPTCLNNIETFANIAVIINKGSDWFSSIGTENSKGTKVFALAGKINNVGLIEVPMGTTMKEIIYDVGGGIFNNREFRSVQTGGPSGGFLSEEDLNTPIDYDNLRAKGSMMGSGAMIVVDEDNCMPALSKFYLEFSIDESCGKCTPCRVGTKRMYEILDKITTGKATMADIDYLKNLGNVIKDTALCGLGQAAPNPILSSIDKFKDEYIAHIKDQKCPAGQCVELLQYVINPDKCNGCTACKRVCAVNCIHGKVKEVHSIDQEACIKCGACYDKCKFGAIDKK